jgi:hypothetical protein
MDWIDLAQDGDQWRTLANTVMNLRVPQNIEKFWSCCTTGGSSRRAQLHGVGHHSTTAPYASITAPLKYAVVLNTQHIITFSDFKLWASSVTRNLSGYGSRKLVPFLKANNVKQQRNEYLKDYHVGSEHSICLIRWSWFKGGHLRNT